MLQPIRPLELMKDSNITKSEFTDFIGVWDEFVPAYLCEQVINHFNERLNNASLVAEFSDGENQFANRKLGRDDISLLLNHTDTTLATAMNQYLQACSLHYVDKYPQLKNVKMFSSDLKMQKTEPEGGYHVWHYEASNYSHATRELVWIIYLNDMPDGEGETEFLYQHRRIKPTRGTVVIWPGGLTHVHRGLTVYSKDKYILTGWYYQVP
jgi:hypothetical protein